jgi:hypothetical protein
MMFGWLKDRGGALLAIATALGSSTCGGPTTPSCTDQYGRGETALNYLALTCATVGSQLQCQSEASISGLYVYCPKSEDVTSQATWTVGNPAVARVVAPGMVEATGLGDTTITASFQASSIITSSVPFSVFAGMPPQRTYYLTGSVYQPGTPLITGGINGAVIQMLDGIFAGRTATSGVPPPPLPGYFVPAVSAGQYYFLGVPAGTYRLRVTKDGYTPQECTISVAVPSIVYSPCDFPLQPM